tara:strand:- start:1659 stop:2186 length:528 start_codon:yes stop_codon:yes gene_type:complete
MRHILIALIAMHLLGCGKLGGEESPITDKTEALRLYSEASEQTRAARETVIESWKTLTQAKTAEIFQEILGQRVLPQFQSYLSAVRSIESNIPELNRSHKALVAAYEKAYTDLVDLEKTISSQARALSSSQLKDVVKAWIQAEKDYWNSVEKIYGQHGFLLEPRDLELKEEAPKE